MRIKILRWTALWLLCCCLGCGGPAQPDVLTTNAGQRMPVVLQLNWYPEAEHGGFYAALVEGIFAAEGLDVEIRPGGRATPVAAELSLGRAQFAISNAADVLLFREQGADVVAVMAAMQDNPRCIIVREDSDVENLQQLAGLTLQLGTGRPFVEFLKQSGVLQGVQVVPYFGTVSQLVTTPNIAQQGYVFSEPLLAEEAGVPVRALMVSDLGFNPYASVLVTSGQTLRDRPELVEKVVRTCVRGWEQYLETPDATNEYIVTQNKHGLTLAALTYGVKKMQPLVLPNKNSTDSLGLMTLERWQKLLEQMSELGLVSADKVTAKDCYQNYISP